MGAQISVPTGGDDGMNGNNGDSEERKELRVFIISGEKRKQVSRWIFLKKLRFCFKIADGNWQSIPYDKGIEICRRIVSKGSKDSAIKVVGSMVEELQKEEMVSELFDKGRIVIGGVQ